MKKLLFAAVCVLLQAAALLFFSACAENSYRMSAVYLENEQALSVSLDFVYVNETGQALDSVIFNVYANVFRRESTLPYDNATLTEAFPYGYAPSGIEFTDVRFNGELARYRFLGSGECYLSVRSNLPEGEKGLFHFEYTLLLSKNRAFQGCGEDVRLTLFYPGVCVWDGGFVMEPTSRAAAFLYADKASFEVSLYLPDGYEIACGADARRASSEDGYRLYELHLNDANELALAASRRYYTYEQQLPSGSLICVKGNRRALCKEALVEAAEAAELYEAWFGPLPFGKVEIAFADICRDLSLPGLILLDGSVDEWDALRIGDLLAQQYFGCAVTSDPQLDPFLRYGTSCYAALLQLKAARGEEAFVNALTDTIEPALKMTVPGSLTPDSSLSRFTTVYDFDVVVRRRGAAVLHEICLVMGEDAFLAGLKQYINDNRAGQSNIERFVAALDAHASHTIGNALIAWLMTIDEYVQQDGSLYR